MPGHRQYTICVIIWLVSEDIIMKLLAIDVGGTEIKYGLVDEGFRITDNNYVPTPLESLEGFLNTIYGIYQGFSDQVKGIAMSLPGFIDTETGYCYTAGALKYYMRTNLGELLAEKCGCPVVLENDGKAAALAEYSIGSLQGCTNAAVFIIGTGIGGGLIVNKQLVKGLHFSAGEFSFLLTDINHPLGLEGTMAMKCSTPALLEMYRQKKGRQDRIDGRAFFGLLKDDEDAQTVLDQYALNVATQIYNLYYLLDLEKIAIGGGISRQSILIEKIREKFHELVEHGPGGKHVAAEISLEIVPCQYYNDANLLGACIAYRRQKGQ